MIQEAGRRWPRSPAARARTSAIRLGLALAFLAGCILTAPAWAASERRVALVIGNSAYAEAPLRNPVNDARAMASVLRDLDFDVMLLENADRAAMQRATLEFGRRLKDDVAGLFYFAGHGMQVRGVNYLIPVGAQATSEEEVEVEAVDVNYILARMATARNQFNIVILDACRNNPFERSFRSNASGLAAISAPRGTLIAYATAPGSVAADGDGQNGLYTGELIAALKTPDLPLEQTFKRARAEVVQKSGGRQTPWESSSVIGDFVFLQRATAVASLPQTMPQQNGDTALWNAVKDSREPADYRAYIETYPQGLYVRLAQSRIQTLSAARAGAPAAAADPRAKTADPKMAEQPTKSAETQVASLSMPPTSFDPRAGLNYVKANWSAIQEAIKKHFHHPSNLQFYASLTMARHLGQMTLYSISFYDIAAMSDSTIDLVVLLQGATPSTVTNGYLTSYAQYMRYRFERQDRELVIREYMPIPKSEMMARESD